MKGLLFAILALPAAVAAQVGTVTVERENFRATPNGAILAEVLEGTELRVGDARDRWREVTIEGWIWSASVRAERRDGHDLVVTPGGGENLRVVPNGDILARLRPGMLLDRVEEDGNWVRVRRTAWLWEPSLEIVAAPAAENAAPTTARDLATAGARGLVVLARPGGDTLGRLVHGATVEVVAREGDWARVRIDGWTRTASITPDGAETDVLGDVSHDELASEPERYRGRLVQWTVHFIALQKAERFRTDFVEGESFILAKGPGDDAGFVYLAVPPEWLEAVRSLAPLQRIQVLGRIRTAQSSLTNAPVIDLIDLVSRNPAPRR